MQRALMQFRAPQNHQLVRKALRLAGREDLIGYGRECLVPPGGSRAPGKPSGKIAPEKKTTARQAAKKPVKRSDKWAKAKPKKR